MSESFQRRSPIRFYNWISIFLLLPFASFKFQRRKKNAPCPRPTPNEQLYSTCYIDTRATCNIFVRHSSMSNNSFWYSYFQCTLLRYRITTGGRWHSIFLVRCVCVCACNLMLLHNSTVRDFYHSISYVRISNSTDSRQSQFLVFTWFRRVFVFPPTFFCWRTYFLFVSLPVDDGVGVDRRMSNRDRV